MKPQCVLVAAISLGVVGTQQVSADSIINGFGLVDPALHITFDEFVFPSNTQITDQYSALDVVVSDTPPLEYDNQGGADFIEGIEGHYLGKVRGGVEYRIAVRMICLSLCAARNDAWRRGTLRVAR